MKNWEKIESREDREKSWALSNTNIYVTKKRQKSVSEIFSFSTN